MVNAQGALSTLLNLMALPGAILMATGGSMWYNGAQKGEENKSRYGRMLVMFGAILLAIVIILSFFIGIFAESSSTVN